VQWTSPRRFTHRFDSLHLQRSRQPSAGDDNFVVNFGGDINTRKKSIE